MALTDENGSNMVMPVAPMYGNGGGDGFFGGNSGWWIILLFVLLGGWGNGFGGYSRMSGKAKPGCKHLYQAGGILHDQTGDVRGGKGS